MAKESKFGAFGGVFTPSILTILGVIMYLRLPWVVGQAGLVQALGIVLVAHVISIATGLSISSIATDKNVGAGGPYYIVSRSLGLPIGGTLGLALFVGLCFSISLYVIGFSESFLGTLEVERTPGAIRLCGTITLIALTLVTIISTAFAIKTQYIILGLIAASLFSIFFGQADYEPAAEVTTEAAPSLAVLFGIFFPAVTGFTAGVNMSGDLKNPNKAIPVGTMAAILVGLVVYIGLSFFLFTRVDRELLISDPDVLLHIAAVPSLVIAGIWGATLSSGLGSILGAPRILQALSSDNITPRVFAKGFGPTKEPRNALVLAFAIAEAGILIAELDAIARIVSMVFLTTYAFLNLSCAIEAWVSPDFRPAFRIPSFVSVVGAVTCVVIMIQLDLVAMLGATAFMVGLFVWLQRRQLELEAGDAWEGIWASIIRSGLFRLTHSEKKQRNWRPNILSFRRPEHGLALPRFAEGLITGNGILTDFEFTKEVGESQAAPKKKEKKKKKKKQRFDQDDAPVGVFKRNLEAKDEVVPDIALLVENYGFSGLEPNALLLPWELVQESGGGLGKLVDRAADRDFNVLLYSHGEVNDKASRIDIWWRPDAGNIAFSLALLRFLTRASPWEEASLRFLLLSPDSANNDNLRTALKRILREGRIEASVKVVNDSFGDRSFTDRVRGMSDDAALTILGLPNEPGQIDEELRQELDELTRYLGRALFVKGSSAFKEVLPTGRGAAVSELPPLPEGADSPEQLPEIRMPEVPDLANAVTDFSESYQRLVGRLSEQGLKKVYGRHVELIRAVHEVVDRQLGSEKALAGNPRRRRNAFNRIQSSLLLECQVQLDEFADRETADLRAILDGVIDSFLHDDEVLVSEEARLLVHRKNEDMKPDKEDSPYVRGFKRRRRFGAWLFRRQPRYSIPLAPLRRYYFERAKAGLLYPSIRGFATETHQMAVQLGKMLNSSRAELSEEHDDPAKVLEAQRKQLVEHLDALDQRGKELLRRRRWALITGALELSQAYSDDIERLDVHLLIKKERSVEAEELPEDLGELPATWMGHQNKLLQRAHLALSISGFQHRLTTIVGREREALEIGIKNGALSECEALTHSLQQLRDELDKGPEEARRVDLKLDGKNLFDPGSVLQSLTQDVAGGADELPASLLTLSDESIQALEEGRTDGIEEVEIPVRRLVQFLVETELVGGLSEELNELPRLERQALGIAQDVERLVSFQINEFDSDDGVAPEEFKAQMLPVVENGIERLKAQRQLLSDYAARVVAVLDEKLHLVVDGSNAYELGNASERLDQYIRVEKGRRAVSGLRGLFRKRATQARERLVRLIYRRSEGVLLARQRRAERVAAGTAVDRIAAMVRAELPKREIVEQLPFYYRQLFIGQSGINDTFWVGRQEQLSQAKIALKIFDSGKPGALFVVGDRLSGRTALLQRMGTEVFAGRSVFRIHPPPGGTISVRAFDRALGKAIESEADLEGDLSVLPRGSVVVIDDLELFWERTDDGLSVIRRIIDLIRQHGRRVMFVLSMEKQAYRFVNRLVPLSDRALAVLNCEPLPAAALRSIVTLRHASTGLRFQWGDKGEEQLSDLALARLFSAYFDHTGGSVGATLRTWVGSIRRYKADTLYIEPPQRRDWEALDSLRPEWVALLVELLLHKQLGPERLRRVTGLPRDVLRMQVEGLLTTGLVVESQKRILELQPGMCQPLRERLAKRGFVT